MTIEYSPTAAGDGDSLELDLGADAPSVGARGVHWWIARRLALCVVVLLVVSAAVFVATQALPSDPAEAMLGKNATPSALAQVRQELGLDRSLPAQYVSWLGGVVTGDLGHSLVGGAFEGTRPSVWSLVGSRLGNSLLLLVFAAGVAIPLSVALGVATAIRRDRAADRVILLGSLVLTALPEFVIGLILVMLFATSVMTILPAVVVVSPNASPLADPSALILPILTLVLATVPYLYRLMRASMVDVLESEYVVMARLKGMPERRVTIRHALPNALIPVVQASSLVLAYLLAGIVVVEYIFGYPGLGTLLTDSVAHRDFPTIQATVLIFAAGVVLFNLAADVITVFATPKLRTMAGRR